MYKNKKNSNTTSWRWKKVEKKDERLKYEIAEELGLLDKVLKSGWKSLTAKETGRIGGLVTRRKKLMEDGKKA
jgi:small acid-soluble spore protein F (minor alpha/beta-type SASP)